MGFYVGSLYADLESSRKIVVKEKERERVAKECKVILATYGKVSIGTDIETLSGLVLATPTSDVLQTVGRIVRIMDGKKSPIVVDFVDTYYKDAVGWAYNRRKFYQEHNYYMKEVS
jgi:predicted helicase